MIRTYLIKAIMLANLTKPTVCTSLFGFGTAMCLIFGLTVRHKQAGQNQYLPVVREALHHNNFFGDICMDKFI